MSLDKNGLVFSSERHEDLFDELCMTANEGCVKDSDRRSLLSFSRLLLLEEMAMEKLMAGSWFIEVSGDKGQIITRESEAFKMMDRIKGEIRAYYKEFKMTPASKGKAIGTTTRSKKISSDV